MVVTYLLTRLSSPQIKNGGYESDKAGPHVCGASLEGAELLQNVLGGVWCQHFESSISSKI